MYILQACFSHTLQHHFFITQHQTMLLVIMQNHLKILYRFKKVFNIIIILFKEAPSWADSVAQKDLTGSELEHVSETSV